MFLRGVHRTAIQSGAERASSWAQLLPRPTQLCTLSSGHSPVHRGEGVVGEGTSAHVLLVRLQQGRSKSTLPLSLSASIADSGLTLRH